MYDVAAIRRQFPMLAPGRTVSGHPLVYLDNSATTFKPQRVIDAVTGFYTEYTSNVHRGDYQLAFKADQAYDGVRKKVAAFIHCDPDEVVYTSGSTGSLNLVAYGYGEKVLKEGDVVLSTLTEHASDILPWFRVCEKTGAKVEYIPLDAEGRVTVENFQQALHPGVKIVALTAVSNVLGTITPIKEICALAHQAGAVVSVDGAQSVPHLKTDVRDLDCDFLAFSAHKLCGPSGTGVLYGKKALLQQMDPYLLGGDSNARFNSHGDLILKEPPVKFEAGTPNIEGVIGMGAAIDFLQEVGMDAIAEHERQLRSYLMERLSTLDNLTIYNPHGDTGIVSFNVKGIFAQDAAGYLASQGICVRSGNHCAKMLVEFLGTDASIRASFYLYNTEAEMDALVKALSGCTLEKCVGIFF